MEAVPRLPMLSFDLKVSPESTSFGPKLKQYIRDVYNEDPEMYSNEIHSLEGMRATAVCAPRDVTGCSVLKRYYCQLHFLQSRFPMVKDGAAAVSFTWRDTYASMVCTLADIRFEMVSILYNIGALHSQLGASDTRVTADGMKLSCTHFQCAAWAFQHLKDTFPQPAGVDLAPDVMQFMYHLCLAQAQECILEKSMMDNRKATIIAKVAVQIVDYYNLAHGILEQSGNDDCSVAETVGSKIYKNWKRYVKFKIAYHSCVSLLYQGQQAEEQQKMGERVAYYQAASEKLEEAIKLSKGMDSIEAVNEALTFTMDVVEGKKKAAKNENEFIYHEEVPDKDSLANVKGASLVKGIPFSVNDPDVSGADIFARLVPMKAHESASLYSEEKAKLLRRIGGMVEEKDQELETFMASLQLEHLNIRSEQDRLPQDLVDRCAALSAKPSAIQNLVDSMNKLADIYHDVECMLQEIKQLLEQEEGREKEYQQVMGKRPPSIVATDLTREANKYQEAHAKASESNQTLHKAMTLHISNLKILSQPLQDLQKHIPSIYLDSPADETSEKEMQYLTHKVDDMRKKRAMLVSELRKSVCQDDITHQLVTHTGESLDAVFNQEMEKHQTYVNLIEQNLTAQGNILKALTEAYARYAGTRKAVTELVRKRDTTINALISSYDAYEDLLAKSSKGLEFYRKLETNVSKLLQRVKGTCKVQEEEREQILAKNKKTAEVESTVPKLKDYLQGMKQGGTGYVSGYSTAYYNNSNYAPVASSVTPQVPPESTVQQHFIPAVRPAPVGSEGTSEQAVAVKFDSGETKVPKPSYVTPVRYPATTYSTSTQYNYTDTYPYAYTGQYQNFNIDEKSQENSCYYGVYPSTLPYTEWQQNMSNVSVPTTTSASNYSQFQTETMNSYQTQSLNLNSTSAPSYHTSMYQTGYQTTTPSPNLSSSTASPSQISSYQQYQYPYSYPQDSKATEFQYMASSGNSYYTNAGTYDTSQTCSAQTPYPMEYGGTSQTPYYSLPYGYQYGIDTTSVGVVVQSPQSHDSQQNVNQNQSTYMQARGENNNTTTTYSQQGGTLGPLNSSQSDVSCNGNASNVDLLAGLDFSLNQAPLVPQQQPSSPALKKEEEEDKNTSLLVKPVTNISVTKAASDSLETNEEVGSLDESQEEGKMPKSFGKDPYTDPEALNQFVQEVGKYEKFVDGLTTKTLNGPTPLDMKWKELLELQEKDAHRRSISVARCYPMKNRFSDILPYDHSRIELPSTKDDYINASYIKNLTSATPPFIATQAPLPSTYSDFWTMVWEQQVEVIVCLLNDTELQGQIYWPVQKGQELAMGKMKLTLQSSNVRSHWTERIISICVVETRATRVIVHLQLTVWPGSSFPPSPGPFLCFVSETLNLYMQQRGASHPVVVHCLSGVGRTGLFCLVAAALCEIQAGRGLLDLVTTTATMSTFRKGSLRDREHLKFAYQAVLYYSQDLLMKRGILTSRSTFEDKRSRGGKSHTRHPSEDFLLGPTTGLSQLQSGIEKMGCSKQQ